MILVATSASYASAQQLAQFTYFTYNYLNYNPAVTGATPCMELKLGHRRQWMGLPGAPITSFVNVHGKFGQKKYNYHGIGGVVETDDAGPFSYTALHFNYAYHMRMARKFMFSSGIGLGFLQYRMNYGDITLQNQNNDPAVTSSVSEFLKPTVNIGFWLYNTSVFYGLSIRQVTTPKLKDLGQTKIVKHWTFSAGKAVKMSDDLTFKPAALINYAAKSKPSIEAQAVLAYKEKVSVGMAARSGNGLAFLLKLDVVKYVTFAYSYDLTMSKLRNPGASSHELTIGLRACAEKEKLHVPCAAYN